MLLMCFRTSLPKGMDLDQTDSELLLTSLKQLLSIFSKMTTTKKWVRSSLEMILSSSISYKERNAKS